MDTMINFVQKSYYGPGEDAFREHIIRPCFLEENSNQPILTAQGYLQKLANYQRTEASELFSNYMQKFVEGRQDDKVSAYVEFVMSYSFVFVMLDPKHSEPKIFHTICDFLLSHDVEVTIRKMQLATHNEEIIKRTISAFYKITNVSQAPWEALRKNPASHSFFLSCMIMLEVLLLAFPTGNSQIQIQKPSFYMQMISWFNWFHIGKLTLKQVEIMKPLYNCRQILRLCYYHTRIIQDNQALPLITRVYDYCIDCLLGKIPIPSQKKEIDRLIFILKLEIENISKLLNLNEIGMFLLKYPHIVKPLCTHIIQSVMNINIYQVCIKECLVMVMKLYEKDYLPEMIHGLLEAIFIKLTIVSRANNPDTIMNERKLQRSGWMAVMNYIDDIKIEMNDKMSINIKIKENDESNMSDMRSIEMKEEDKDDISSIQNKESDSPLSQKKISIFIDLLLRYSISIIVNSTNQYIVDSIPIDMIAQLFDPSFTDTLTFPINESLAAPIDRTASTTTSTTTTTTITNVATLYVEKDKIITFVLKLITDLGGRIYVQTSMTYMTNANTIVDTKINTESIMAYVHLVAQLLDRYFTIDAILQYTGDNNNNEKLIEKYIQPFHALLYGVAQQANINKRQKNNYNYGRTDNSWRFHYVRSIMYLFKILTETIVYADSLDMFGEKKRDMLSPFVEESLQKLIDTTPVITTIIEDSYFTLVTDDSIFFQLMHRLESSLIPLKRPLSSTYIHLSKVFSQNLATIEYNREVRLNRLSEIRLLDKLLDTRLALLSSNTASTSNCYILMYYIIYQLEKISEYIQKNRFNFPPNLRYYPQVIKDMTYTDMKYVDSKDNMHDNTFENTAQPHHTYYMNYMSQYQNCIKSVLDILSTKEVSKFDLTIIEREKDTILTISKAFDINMISNDLHDFEDLVVVDVLNVEFITVLEDIDRLKHVLSFLHVRKLCPEFQTWNQQLLSIDLNHTSLLELTERYDHIVSAISLQTETLTALKKLYYSELFSDRFDAYDTTTITPTLSTSAYTMNIMLHTGAQYDVIDIIERKTKAALDSLELLVFNNDVHIHDFTTSMTGVLAELKGTGRKQRKMEKELEVISKFFTTLYDTNMNSPSTKKRCRSNDSYTMNRNNTTTTTTTTTTAATLSVRRGGVQNISIDQILTRLNSAFTIVKYRTILPQFFVALHEFHRGHLIEHISNTIIIQIQSNFLVVEAPSLLQQITISLSGITGIYMEIIHHLSSTYSLSSGLLLSFYKRYHTQEALDRVLEHAMNRAAGNAHATSILAKLPVFREFLEPFWNTQHTVCQTLNDYKLHFDTHVRILNPDNPETMSCPTLLELDNLIQNWTDCEIYFRDGLDNTDTGDIERLIQIYQKNGVFLSSLQSHTGGSHLCFQYTNTHGKVIQLSSEVLQEHVQWAVLAGSDPNTRSNTMAPTSSMNTTTTTTTNHQTDKQKCLEEFVTAYNIAIKIHQLYLQLEQVGHPKYQSMIQSESMSIATSCNCEELEAYYIDIKMKKLLWEEQVKTACTQCPRLQLLSQHSRVYLIIHLCEFMESYDEDDEDEYIKVANSLLSYIIQCFPNLIGMRILLRTQLIEVLRLLAEEFYGNRVTQSDDLNFTVYILQQLEQLLVTYLDDTWYDRENFTITRMDIQGASELEAYYYTIRDMISSNVGVADSIPALLWCSEYTEYDHIRDIIAVMETGICPIVHIVYVNCLQPRIREELLKVLQLLELQQTLKCAVILIFTSHDGMDAFKHYELEDNTRHLTAYNINIQELRGFSKAYWPQFSLTGGEYQDKLSSSEVWVVTGSPGSGKSVWIQNQVEAITTATTTATTTAANMIIDLNLMVHEGFKVSNILDQYDSYLKQYSSLTSTTITTILRITVTEFYPLSDLHRFLHYLFTLGVLLDDSIGRSSVLLPNTALKVFIELPAVFTSDSLTTTTSSTNSNMTAGSEKNDNQMSTCWPPIHTNTWNIRDHPHLKELPVLSVVTAADHYISIKNDSIFHMNTHTQYVAACMHVYITNNQNIDRLDALLSSYKQQPPYGQEHHLNTALNTLFNRYLPHVPSKRIRAYFIELLYTRVKLLQSIQEKAYKERDMIDGFRCFDRFKNYLTIIFELMIQECVQLILPQAIPNPTPHINTGLNTAPNNLTYTAEVSIFSLIPENWEQVNQASSNRDTVDSNGFFREDHGGYYIQEYPPEADFEMLIISPTNHHPEYQQIIQKYPSIKSFILNDNMIDLALIRASLGPVFGMKDTGNMSINLRDAGHIITQDSLHRLLTLHYRRSVKSNLIYEGETGCGKSQNVKLYSHLINANSNLFTNLKLHLLAIIQVLVKVVTNTYANITITPNDTTSNNTVLLDNGNFYFETIEELEVYRIAAKEIENLSYTCTIDELTQRFHHWIECGDEQLINDILIVILIYFYQVLYSYPLYAYGLSENLYIMFSTFGKMLHKHFPTNVEIQVTYGTQELARLRIQNLISKAVSSPILTSLGHIKLIDTYEVWPKPNTFLHRHCHDADNDYTANNGDDDDDDGEEVVDVDDDTIVDLNEITEQFMETYRTNITDFLQQIVATTPVSLYYRLLADEGLTPMKWRHFMSHIINESKRIQKIHYEAVICIFIDETNTAGCLGMVSEAFLSHTIDGKPIPENIVFIGAINPYRKSSIQHAPAMDFTTSNIRISTGNMKEQSKSERNNETHDDDYLANIPYIVKNQPPNMLELVVNFPNLGANSETLFLQEYFNMHVYIDTPMNINLNSFLNKIKFETYKEKAIHMIVTAQNLIKSYNIPRVYMSIRNLIRATKLLSWLLNFKLPTTVDASGKLLEYANIFLPNIGYTIYNNNNNNNNSNDKKVKEQDMIDEYLLHMRHALLIAITITYLFQLPSEGHVLAQKALLNYHDLFLLDIVSEWNKQQRDTPITNNEWKHVITQSLEHLWSHAHIPKGLAKTDALMTGFYCNILSAETKNALLVTGPPGCGKTLGFNLANENLRGPYTNHSIAFQHMKKSMKFMYQCSKTSSGPEIATKFKDAYSQQIDLDIRQPGKHICVVGIDEAGLTPENRQALKSLHDYLDERVISTTMMSNTTLDAAKTSRVIQILQTQANLMDLYQLAEGLLVDEAKMIPDEWTLRINGLTQAYYNLHTVIPHNNWFHSRDFVYLCRFLHKLIQNQPPISTLFDASMLLSALRRHFQPFDSTQFPILALHFLTSCHFDDDVIDTLDMNAKVVESLKESLQDIVDVNAENTETHCRYTLVIDPTDSEASIDLLFSMKLLDTQTTRVIELSDFPEDSTPTRQTAALAQIKHAIESGDSLLLKNSAPLQSALYDVINRHYSISVREEFDEVDININTNINIYTETNRSSTSMSDDKQKKKMIREAHARIALGSFSSYVKIHPNFRLIVHIPQSEIPKTPLPFLNRLEKYPFNVHDALIQRIQEIALNPPLCLQSIITQSHRKVLFTTLLHGVEDFVTYIGGIDSFYGYSSETVAALILSTLDESVLNNSAYYEPRQSSYSLLKRRYDHLLHWATMKQNEKIKYDQSDSQSNTDMRTVSLYDDSHVTNQEEEHENSDMIIDEDDINDINSTHRLHDLDDTEDIHLELSESMITESMLQDIPISPNTADPSSTLPQGIYEHTIAPTTTSSSSLTKVMHRMKQLIRILNYRMLEIMRAERLFHIRHRLPAAYLHEYIDHQQHFSVMTLLQTLVHYSLLNHHYYTASISSTTNITSSTSHTNSDMNMRHSHEMTVNSIPDIKLVIYTRTDVLIQRLGSDQNPQYALQLLTQSLPKYQLLNSITPNMKVFILTSDTITHLNAIQAFHGFAIVILQLSAFMNSTSCEKTIRCALCTDNGPRLLLLIADTKICTTNQITFARRIVDSQLSQLHTQQQQEESYTNNTEPIINRKSHIYTERHATESKEDSDNSPPISDNITPKKTIPMVVFILHISADLLHLRPVYQTIPLNNWSAMYVDSFSTTDDDVAMSSVETSTTTTTTTATTENDNTIIDLTNEESTSSSSSSRDNESTNVMVENVDVLSLRWIRVAYSLSAAPSLADVRHEFSHLIDFALDYAVKSCNFQQQPRKLNKGSFGSSGYNIIPLSQFFQTVGIKYALPAYRQNDRTWVMRLIKDRPYLVYCILDTFAQVWGKLLEYTVQKICHDISRGLVSAGLVATIRTTHRWLLTDFMCTLLRKELASHWNLEALASLPNVTILSDSILYKSTSTSTSIVNTSNTHADIQSQRIANPDLCDTNKLYNKYIQAPLAVEIKLLQSLDISQNPIDLAKILITIHMMKASVSNLINTSIQKPLSIGRKLNPSPNQLNSSSTNTYFDSGDIFIQKVDCQQVNYAPQIPLYSIFIRLIQDLIPDILSTSRQNRYKNHFSQLHIDERNLRQQLQKSKYEPLNRTLYILESRPDIYDIWISDFIRVTLGYGYHTQEELLLLTQVTMELPFLQSSSSSTSAATSTNNRKHLSRQQQHHHQNSKNQLSIRNVCLWILAEKQIKSYLATISRFLISCQGILSPIHIQRIMSTVTEYHHHTTTPTQHHHHHQPQSKSPQYQSSLHDETEVYIEDTYIQPSEGSELYMEIIILEVISSLWTIAQTFMQQTTTTSNTTSTNNTIEVTCTMSLWIRYMRELIITCNLHIEKVYDVATRHNKPEKIFHFMIMYILYKYIGNTGSDSFYPLQLYVNSHDDTSINVEFSAQSNRSIISITSMDLLHAILVLILRITDVISTNTTSISTAQNHTSTRYETETKASDVNDTTSSLSDMIIDILLWIIHSPDIYFSSSYSIVVIAGLLGLNSIPSSVITTLSSLYDFEEYTSMDNEDDVYNNTSENTRDALLEKVFNVLNFNARSELLKKLLVLRRDETEVIMNTLLSSTIHHTQQQQQLQAHENTIVYIPSFVLAAQTTYATRELLGTNILQELPIDKPYLLFNIQLGGKESSQIAYHSIRLYCYYQESLLGGTKTGDTLSQLVQEFRILNVTDMYSVSRITYMIYAIRILDETATYISEHMPTTSTTTTNTTTNIARNDRANSSILTQLNNKYPLLLGILCDIIAMAPRVLSLYFLSRLNNIDIVMSVLHDRLFLEQLRLTTWYIPRMAVYAANAALNEEEVRTYTQQTERNKVKIISIYLASKSVEYALYTHQLILPTQEMILASTTQTMTSSLQQKCMKCVQLLLDYETMTSLAANQYIPILMSMYIFIKEKLAYILENELQARELTIEQSLELLSPLEKIEGRQLYKQFLYIWQFLQRRFTSFVICAREIGAAAEIPLLTDQYGSRPTTIADLVELLPTTITSNTTTTTNSTSALDSTLREHESLIARMFEKRLIKQINDILSHDDILQLRSDTNFNHMEYLCSPDAQEEYLSQLCTDTDHHHTTTTPSSSSSYVYNTLLTGIIQSDQSYLASNTMENSRTKELSHQSIHDYIICHTTWIPTTSNYTIPDHIQEDGTNMIDYATAFQQKKEEQAREAQMQAHLQHFVRCPNCGMLGERISGCTHLTCGSPNNAYGDINTVVQGHGLGRLGCGKHLEWNTHRVPMPTPNGPILPNFMPEKSTITADLLQSQVPKLPQLTPITGQYVLNYSAVAKYLLSYMIHGRYKWNTNDDLFSPMPYKQSLIHESTTIELDLNKENTYIYNFKPLSSDNNIMKNILTSSHWDTSIISTNNITISNPLYSTIQYSNIFLRLRLAKTYLLKKMYDTNSVITNILSPNDTEKLTRLANRYDEAILRRICEQLLLLCPSIYTLISDSDSETACDILSCITIQQQMEELSAIDLSISITATSTTTNTNNTATAASSATTWDPLMMKELGDYSLVLLPPLIDIFTTAGLDGGRSTVHTSLNVALPNDEIRRLEKIYQDIIDELNLISTVIESDSNSTISENEKLFQSIMNQYEELQVFGGILIELESQLLKTADNKILRELNTIATFLSTKANTNNICIRLVGKLKVMHYGGLIRYIKRILSSISYSRLQYTFIHQQKLSSSSQSGRMNTEHTSLDTTNSATTRVKHQSDDDMTCVYVEKIPEDWREFQELDVGVHGEFIMTAQALLRHLDIKPDNNDNNSDNISSTANDSTTEEKSTSHSHKLHVDEMDIDTMNASINTKEVQTSTEEDYMIVDHNIPTIIIGTIHDNYISTNTNTSTIDIPRSQVNRFMSQVISSTQTRVDNCLDIDANTDMMAVVPPTNPLDGGIIDRINTVVPTSTTTTYTITSVSMTMPITPPMAASTNTNTNTTETMQTPTPNNMNQTPNNLIEASLFSPPNPHYIAYEIIQRWKVFIPALCTILEELGLESADDMEYCETVDLIHIAQTLSVYRIPYRKFIVLMNIYDNMIEQSNENKEIKNSLQEWNGQTLSLQHVDEVWEQFKNTKEIQTLLIEYGFLDGSTISDTMGDIGQSVDDNLHSSNSSIISSVSSNTSEIQTNVSTHPHNQSNITNNNTDNNNVTDVNSYDMNYLTLNELTHLLITYFKPIPRRRIMKLLGV